jgi:hypothetical protein
LPSLVKSEAADVRRDRRLVRSLASRRSSREGGKVAERSRRCPRAAAAADDGGDDDIDTDDFPALSFKASLLCSMPPLLFCSLDDWLRGDLAGDRGSCWVCPITTTFAIVLDRPARSWYRAEATAAAHRGVGRVKTHAEGYSSGC